MTITKQQLVDKYNEVYAADNGVDKTFVQLTKDEKVEALLQFVTAISGDASAANQTAVQANPGSNASKAIAIQGVTGGKSLPVTGTFWQTTQPVSAGSLPLPTGASTSVLQTTANTSLASIDTKTPALGQALAADSTPVVLPAAQITALTPPTSVGLTGTLPAFTTTPTVNIGTAPTGLAYESTAIITRAANVTPYAANDVYGGVFELTNIGASGGFVFLASLSIIFNITALPSGMGGFAVYLFNATPPSAITDNLPYSLNSGDRASIRTLNGLNLTASLAARGNGGSVVAEALDINQLFKLATGSTSLWGYLVTLSAFTSAANSETATIRAVSFAP